MRILLLLVVACTPLLAADKPAIDWVKLIDACPKAASESKNVLYAISSPPDEVLKAVDGTDLWSEADVVEVVNELFVATQGTPDDMAATRTYHVRGAPTILILKPSGDDVVRAENPVFADTAAFVKWLKAINPALEQLEALEKKFDESEAKSAKLADALAGSYEKLGRAADAGKVCQRYAETLAPDQPDCGTAWLRAATLYLKGRDLDAAQKAIEGAAGVIKEGDSRQVELRIAKATLLGKQGKYDDANKAFMGLYEELLKAGDARAYDASANVLRTALDKDASDKAYKKANKEHHARCVDMAKALKTDPRVYEIRYAGAVSAYEAGDSKAAKKEMTELAGEQADDPWIKRAKAAVAAWGK